MKHQPITEIQYFTNNTEELRKYYCPNCGEQGGIFIGFKYVGCYKCLTFPDELNEVYDK